MSATNYLTVVYDKIWTLLEAHAPFTSTFKLGNRIRTSGTSRDPFKTALLDGDTPQVTLFQDGFSDTLFNNTRAFNQTTAFNPLTDPWLEDIAVNYHLRVLHRDLQLAVANLAILETLTALRKGGPRWGLSYIANWGPIQNVSHTIVTTGSEGESDGTRRLLTDIPLPVLMRFTTPQSQLTG